MPIHKDQLRSLIRDVLSRVDLWSYSAEELLMLTAAVESDLGTYIRQIGGPARGIFQMEPDTESDIWDNYLFYNPDLQKRVTAVCPRVDGQLEWNLAYQIIMARLHYRRARAALPAPTDIDGMALYWKLYYNTSIGKGTVEKAKRAYIKFVL